MNDTVPVLTAEEIDTLLNDLRKHYGDDMIYGDHAWLETLLEVTNSHIELLKRLSVLEAAA